MGQVAEYMDLIDEMSPFDEPGVFGLHSNADITYMTSTANR